MRRAAFPILKTDAPFLGIAGIDHYLKDLCHDVSVFDSRFGEVVNLLARSDLSLMIKS